MNGTDHTKKINNLNYSVDENNNRDTNWKQVNKTVNVSQLSRCDVKNICVFHWRPQNPWSQKYFPYWGHFPWTCFHFHLEKTIVFRFVFNWGFLSASNATGRKITELLGGISSNTQSLALRNSQTSRSLLWSTIRCENVLAVLRAASISTAGEFLTQLIRKANLNRKTWQRRKILWNRRIS